MVKQKPWLMVTDPWKTLDHPQDTTIRLVEAAVRLKQPVCWGSSKTIRWSQGEVWIDAARMDAAMFSDSSSLRRIAPPEPATHPTRIAEFEQIHYRVDPPVDLAYLHPLQMLAQAARRKLVNPPEAITLLSEKTLGNALPELSPRNLVSSDPERLRDFIEKEETVVLKPLHTAQSQGVMKLNRRDEVQKISAALTQATEGYTRPCMLQEFLPAIQHGGETRLWFVDGKLLAAVQKVPAAGQFKIDMDQGSTLARASLTAKHRPGIRQISSLLNKHKIRLAAVDWIDGKITDLNLTSPGLIVGMEKLLGEDLASKIIKRLQKPS